MVADPRELGASIDVIRRELRRVSPDVRIDSAQIKDVLVNEVIKREVLEGDKADEARKKIARSSKNALRAVSTKSPARGEGSTAE